MILQQGLIASLLTIALALPALQAGAKVTRIEPGEHMVRSVALYSGIQFARIPGSSLQETELYLDLMKPESENPVPVVVFVLGSGWRPTARERLLPQLIEFAKAGYAVASIDYRGSAEAAFPEPQKDVLAAIRYLRSNAASLGLDPDRMALMGNSAGGHLALSAALGADSAIFVDERWAGVSASVDAVIGIYPAAYFQPGVDYFSQHLGVDFSRPDAVAPEGSEPIDLLSAGDPPVMIVQGTADPVVPLSSSERFYEEASAKGHEPELVIVDGIGHNFDQMISVPEVREAMLRFLDRTVR